jgi:hypothetical protein
MTGMERCEMKRLSCLLKEENRKIRVGKPMNVSAETGT